MYFCICAQTKTVISDDTKGHHLAENHFLVELIYKHVLKKQVRKIIVTLLILL